jgi:tripartite-type tricarboxylate transporter receptor subunit TctC
MKSSLGTGFAAGLAAAIAVAAPHAASQSSAYPTKPVRLIVASGAGGGLDFVARQVAIPLSDSLGQTVVVDNRAGASGSIAAELASQAAPRGTPQPVIERLQREIAKAVQRPEVASRLALDGTEGIASAPDQFAAHLESEREQWDKVVKLANIRGD